MLDFILFTSLFICLIAFISLYKVFVNASTMAIVMALGIIIQGVLFHMVPPPLFIVKAGSAVNIALWMACFFSIALALASKQFTALYTANPLKRFGIGTWVAGTSICTILLFEQFTFWRPAAVTFSYLTIGLWLFYLCLSLRSFQELRQRSDSQPVHGILLLTTVSTQSIVLLLNTIHTHVPILLDRTLILIGFALYIISISFIIRSLSNPEWKIEDHWANTNCIIHGALSITGFACVVSEAVSHQVTLLLWIAVIIIFVFVEGIELIRLTKRLKRYGFKRGLWAYDVTQWSRLFTFGMFYTFTSLVEPYTNFLLVLQENILKIGVPVIFLLFVAELFIYSPFILRLVRKPRVREL